MTVKASGSASRFSDLIPAILFIAAFLLTLYRFTQNPPTGGLGLEVLAVAKSLARDGSFANPYMAAQTGPTAHTSPLYPLYLAFLMRLGGNELRYGFLMILSLIFAHSLQAGLLP
ncbi:MAG TPA: hypothetical protein VL285_01745, partial [Bryobacteraceae bacterium]|nr:hypothetical protein [Bryobacteraceae bacterium]